MTSLNNYYNEIRSDIAKEFGLAAAGLAPAPKYVLPVRVAQRINNKYPAQGTTRYDMVVHPMAKKIAQRYVSLMKAGVIK